MLRLEITKLSYIEYRTRPRGALKKILTKEQIYGILFF
jgi:hypothetical protein